LKNIYIMLILLLIGCNGSNDEINNEEVANEDTTNYGFEFPDWIIGSWGNGYESHSERLFRYRFEKNHIYKSTGFDMTETDLLQNINYDRLVFIRDTSYVGLFFIKNADTISYEFKYSYSEYSNRNILLWNIRDSTGNHGEFYSGSCQYLLLKVN
jgi:hypothetical protein